MRPRPAFWRQSIDIGCTIEIDNDFNDCGAHVTLDGEPEIGPGDRVRVYGPPIQVAFGEHRVVRRRALVERATPIGRLWTRFAGHFQMTELYEVSFSPGRVA